MLMPPLPELTVLKVVALVPAMRTPMDCEPPPVPAPVPSMVTLLDPEVRTVDPLTMATPTAKSLATAPLRPLSEMLPPFALRAALSRLMPLLLLLLPTAAPVPSTPPPSVMSPLLVVTPAPELNTMAPVLLAKPEPLLLSTTDLPAPVLVMVLSVFKTMSLPLTILMPLAEVMFCETVTVPEAFAPDCPITKAPAVMRPCSATLKPKVRAPVVTSDPPKSILTPAVWV